MSDLNSILNGNDEAEPVVEAPVEAPVAAPASAEAPPQPEALAEPVAPAAAVKRDENGRFVPKGDEPAAEAPAPGAPPAPVEEPSLEHPALLAERRKRQAAEAELERLRASPPAPATAAPAPPVPAAPTAPPDRYEDPEGYDAWLVQSVRTQAVAEARAAVEEERIATSADAAREKYPDFADKAKLFAQLTQQNPVLEQTLRRSRNPGEYAYSTAKMHLELQEHGSLEALIAAREVAAREAALAEIAAKPAPEPAPAPSPPSPPVNLPDSLADSQSARTSSVTPQGPPSLEDILNPRT